jgi:hypothetical protein
MPDDPGPTAPVENQAAHPAAAQPVPPTGDGAAGSRKEKPPQKNRMWAKAVKHPAWTTFGALIGIVGLVLSVVQIIQAMQTPPLDLEVAALTSDGQQSVRGTVTGGDAEGTRSIGLTPIELTLQNKGGKPSLITRIDAEIVYFQQLKDCTGAEPTSETIAAKYQLLIPMSDVEPTEKQLASEVRFEVKPGAADRMVLNLGPQTQPAFETTPMLMSARIKLVHDGDQALDVGTASLVTTVDAATAQLDALGSSPSPATRSCAKENLDHLDEMFAIQATRSSLLDSLRSAYQQASV